MSREHINTATANRDNYNVAWLLDQRTIPMNYPLYPQFVELGRNYISTDRMLMDCPVATARDQDLLASLGCSLYSQQRPNLGNILRIKAYALFHRSAAGLLESHIGYLEINQANREVPVDASTSRAKLDRKKKHYVVFKGRQLGVFSSWTEVKASVDGYSGAIHKSYPTGEEARQAFIDSLR